MSYQSEYLDPGATGDPQYQGSRRKGQVPLTQNVMIQNYALNEWMVMDKEVYGGLHRVKYKSLLYRDDIYDGIFSKRRAKGMLCYVEYEDDGTVSDTYYRLKTLPGTEASQWALEGKGSDITLTDPSVVEDLAERDAIAAPVAGQFVNTNDGRTGDEVAANVEAYPASWVYSEGINDWLRVYPYGNNPNFHVRNTDTQILTANNTPITGEEIKTHIMNSNVHKVYNDANLSGASDEAWSSRTTRTEIDKKAGFPKYPTGTNVLYDDNTWRKPAATGTGNGGTALEPWTPGPKPAGRYYTTYQKLWRSKGQLDEDETEPTVDNAQWELVVDADKYLGVTSKPVTHAVLMEMAEDAALAPGSYYRITDYRTKLQTPYTTEIQEWAVEELVVRAIDNTRLSKEATSLSYPNDIIEYDAFNLVCEDLVTPRRGKITMRRSPENIETPEDWRNIKYRRWALDAPDWVAGTNYAQYAVVKDSFGRIMGSKIANNLGNNPGLLGNAGDAVLDHDKWYIIYNPAGYAAAGAGRTKYVAYKTGTIKMGPFTVNVNAADYIDVPVFTTSLGAGNYGAINNLVIKSTIGYYSNTIFTLVDAGETTHHITFGEGCRDNTFGWGLNHDNVIGTGFRENIVTGCFRTNRIGDNTYGNCLIDIWNDSSLYGCKTGNGFYYNHVGGGCYASEWGNNTHDNIWGHNSDSNIIGYECVGNIVRQGMYWNNIKSYFRANVVGQLFRSNNCTIFQFNTVGDSFNNNQIVHMYRGIFGNNCNNNTISSATFHDMRSGCNNFSGNKIFAVPANIYFGDNFINNTFIAAVTNVGSVAKPLVMESCMINQPITNVEIDNVGIAKWRFVTTDIPITGASNTDRKVLPPLDTTTIAYTDKVTGYLYANGIEDGHLMPMRIM